MGSVCNVPMVNRRISDFPLPQEERDMRSRFNGSGITGNRCRQAFGVSGDSSFMALPSSLRIRGYRVMNQNTWITEKSSLPQ